MWIYGFDLSRLSRIRLSRNGNAVVLAALSGAGSSGANSEVNPYEVAFPLYIVLGCSRHTFVFRF